MIEHGKTVATNKDGTVKASFITVGPALAEKLLETYSTDYRKLRPTYAAGLSRDMSNGFWLLDGSPIRFSINDEGEEEIFDGQHRFTAIVDSGTEQEFLVITGLPQKAYNTTDTALARTYGDSLRRRGYAGNIRPALVMLIGRDLEGQSLGYPRRMTNTEKDLIHDKYVDSITRACRMAATTKKGICLPESLLAFAWWKLSSLDKELAYTFLVQVGEGQGLKFGMPAYALRERLLREWKKSTKFTRDEYMNLVYDAWNKFIKGDSATILYNPKGSPKKPDTPPETTPVDPNDYVEHITHDTKGEE